MKMRRVTIHNWRSIKHLEINTPDLLILTGQNNHGKSNVLSAILFFFGTVPCTDMDFNDGTKELYVEILFSELDEHDKAQFAKYISADSTLVVRKEMKMGQPFEYHGYLEIPDIDWLKEDRISEYSTRDAIGATPLASLVPEKGKLSKETIRNAQEHYINDHRSEISFTRGLETSNFLGLKSVAQGIFGEVIYVPAVKNAADDFNPKGKSTFNQLLTSVINEMSASNADYISVKEQIKGLSDYLSKLSPDGSVNERRPLQISRLENLLESELATWNTKIDIEITPPDIDEALKVGTNVWVDDGVSTDVNRKGNGLQRSLIFALIKAWSKVSQEEREKRQASSEVDGQRKASKSTYVIFEEPELYLHPQAQRELFSSLKELARADSQVLLTTHSSSFIDLGLYKSICVICKNSIEEGTSALQYVEDLFPTDDEHKKFNLTYWINPDRGELFFAKKAILVEGASEKTVIGFLAKRIGCFRYDYTIVDCGSKGNIPMFMQLLNKFHLPYIAVYDVDHQAGKTPDAIASADVTSAKIEAALDTKYGSTITMVNDIEEEIGMTDVRKRGKPYAAVEHISQEGYVRTDSLTAKIVSIYS